MTKTQRVRIAVAVNIHGEAGWWGGTFADTGDMEAESLINIDADKADAQESHIVWVEADVPLPPEAPTVTGQIVS